MAPHMELQMIISTSQANQQPPNNLVKYAAHITIADTANIKPSDANDENSKINL